MEILNQPFDGQFGNLLINKLTSNKYKKLIIFSAFAKNSGVLRLKKAFQDFKTNGGEIEAFIGVDAHGTSYEAIQNLFSLVDDLYVIHDKNSSVTFHSKVYILLEDNGIDGWVAIGSNNLTGGGLWTNYENAMFSDIDAKNKAYVKSLFNTLKKYKNKKCEISLRIKSNKDIDELKECDLLRNEVRLQIESHKAESCEDSKRNKKKENKLFGTRGKAKIPAVKRPAKGKTIPGTKGKSEIKAIEPVVQNNNLERMWFETKAMTGGSRNILDLSMLGTIIAGSGSGTRYETDNTGYVLGDVVFFDISPDDSTLEKDITINYNGNDYVGCSIKFASNNGSWRIQLKGEDSLGNKLTSVNGTGWMVNHILVFEKITTDYYVMSVVDNGYLNDLLAQSVFVASNGSAPSSKKYGLINI